MKRRSLLRSSLGALVHMFQFLISHCSVIHVLENIHGVRGSLLLYEGVSLYL